jgi:SAM-dependent methyltransferase
VNQPVGVAYNISGFAKETCDPLLTFRDPAGELQLTEHYAFRRIRPSAAEETQAFLASGLRAALERSGDLIPSRIANSADHPCVSRCELWLEHPRVDPITYPWEWTPAQWHAAAEQTLRVAEQAIESGWTLKDATPLNIVFAAARPVLVDVLSFERRDPNSSVWLAYGQFVRTFLFPLIAAKYLSWPLQATLFWRDGYEPAQIYDALPFRHRLNPNLFDVVTLATLLERPGRRQQASRKPASHADPELATHILLKRIARLRKQICHMERPRSRSQWSEYTQTARHYQPGDIGEKQEFVKNVLQRCGPARVLDLGANTGIFSLMAADCGAEVVAIDVDAAALETLWRAAAAERRRITTVVANIARPTPAAGWQNREHFSLLERLNGKFDLVLMLALIHHLILREQLPLAHVGELCASLTRQWLVLEWVPPSDPMYQEWLRGRDDLYGHLAEGDLVRAFERFFAVADRCELANGRVLLLLERILHAAVEAIASDSDSDAEASLA